MILRLIVGLIKKILLHKMSHYFSLYEYPGKKINVDWHLHNYATKTDLKRPTNIDASNLAAKLDLAGLKAYVHKPKMIPPHLKK